MRIGKIVFGDSHKSEPIFKEPPTSSKLPVLFGVEDFERLLNMEIARLSDRALKAGLWPQLVHKLGKEPLSDSPDILEARILELVYFRNLIRKMKKSI